MGVGFVLGGFCPGTSLVAASTLKIDGILFVLGGLVGVFLFGESVGSYEPFWLSGNLGRFTLPEWLGLSTGLTVLLVVLLALTAFLAAEAIERRFGPARAAVRRRPRLAWAGAGVLLAAGLVLAARGDPGPEQRWRWLPAARSASRWRSGPSLPRRPRWWPCARTPPSGSRCSICAASTTSTCSTWAGQSG